MQSDIYKFVYTYIYIYIYIYIYMNLYLDLTVQHVSEYTIGSRLCSGIYT